MRTSAVEGFIGGRANNSADRGMMVKSEDTTDFPMEPEERETASGMRSNSANSLPQRGVTTPSQAPAKEKV